MAKVDPDGIPVIPVAYHEQRIGELKTAMRNEQLIVIGQRKQVVDEQMECDGVQSLFLRNDLSDADQANVFRRVIEYYKEKPSAEHA